MFADFGRDHFGLEAHGRDVEGVAVDEFARVGFHQVDGGFQRVGHVHHVHEGAFRDGADEFLALHGGIVDLHGVVGGAAAGEGHVGDEARETYRTGVHAEAFEIVVAEQLAGDLGDAVDGFGPLDGVLRGHVVRGVGTESADGTRGEQGAAHLTGYFQAVDEGAHADVPAEHRVGLGLCREDGGEVVDRVDVVFLHRVGDVLRVGGVDLAGGAGLRQRTLQGIYHISGNHIVGSVNCTQCGS